MMTKQSRTPYVRKTMQLTGTAPHSLLRLSHQAAGAGRLSVLMLARAAMPRPTMSAVTRRALLLYAAKLEGMDAEERIRESRAVSRASRAWVPDSIDLQRARKALEAAEESAEAPLPSLRLVTCTPQGPSPEELELLVNRTLKSAMPRKYAHLPTE